MNTSFSNHNFEIKKWFYENILEIMLTIANVQKKTTQSSNEFVDEI
jgi:hypothetical protein